MVDCSCVLEAKPAFSYNAFLNVTQERTVVKNEFSLLLLRAAALKELIHHQQVSFICKAKFCFLIH